MKREIKKGLAVIFIFSLLINLPALLFQRKEEKNLDQCTAIVADKSATLDGRVLIAKNKDLGVNDCQILDMRKRENHPPNSKVRCEYIEIPQAPVTYGWIGMKLPSQWGVGMGVNEFGVAITINAVQSKERFEGRGGLSTADVCRLGLEISRNSREAVELMGNLIEEYGQRVEGAPTITGQIYVIADPEESWILESTVYHWCAVKVNGVEARANQFQITTDRDLGSKDLVDYAIRQGWCKSKEEFNFASCYSAEGYPFASSQTRIERGIELLEPKLGRICIEDLMEVLRDHYENTELYRYPPHKNPNYRTICVGRTSASMVCHLRPWMPGQLQLMWYSVCPPCESIFVPVYAGTTEIFKPWRTGMGGKDWSNYTTDSAWWRFKRLQYYVERDYEVYQPLVREKWDRLYQKELSQIQEFEKKVEKMLRTGKTEQIQLEINKFVNGNLERVYEEVDLLSSELQKV
jgi:secernin